MDFLGNISLILSYFSMFHFYLYICLNLKKRYNNDTKMTNKIKIIWQIVDFITTLPLLGKINYFLFSIHLQYCLVILGGSGLVTKSCPTFACRIKVTCSLPGSSVHGILQARILDWVAISFSKGSS